MKFPKVEEVLMIHEKSIVKFGGRPGLREGNLLYSAVEQIHQEVFGQQLYPTFLEKVAHLGFSLIKNHPFLDGNKRSGFATMMAILAYNDYPLNKEKIKRSQSFIEEIAAGKISYEEIIEWLREISNLG